MKNDGTICAISTPPGSGAIGIIRVSGHRTTDIIKKHLGSRIEPRYVYTGHFKDKERSIDKVNYVLFKGPNSYTGEDMLEIYCHGGQAIQKMIIGILLKGGVMPAKPGEFTLRAILGGKMDLLEAEAINELISGRYEQGILGLRGHLSGSVSKKITDIKECLLELKAKIEASIDFSDSDEISNDLLTQVHNSIKEIKSRIKSIIEGAKWSKILTQGYKVAIIGKPNTGKSSLLNRILQDNRAIVTEYAGTTRDILREELNINGYGVILYDTAGIRDVRKGIEKIGIEKVNELIKNVNCIVFMLDLSSSLSKDDKIIIDRIDKVDKPVIVFLNKSDIKKYDHRNISDIYESRIIGSVKNNKGIKKLINTITELMEKERYNDTECLLFSQRQGIIFKKIYSILNKVDKLKIVSETEIAAQYLNEIIHLLDDLTGKSDFDIHNYIFNNFCIGK